MSSNQDIGSKDLTALAGRPENIGVFQVGDVVKCLFNGTEYNAKVDVNFSHTRLLHTPTYADYEIPT